jgi:phage-related tail fiber protein
MGKQVGSTLDIPQVATPTANPAASRQLLYVKADGKMYTKTSAGSEVLVGPSMLAPVKAVTTGPITLSGTQTIDTIAVVAGDRVLVKEQAAAAANGIYVVAAGAWTRASDADTGAELLGGEQVQVVAGPGTNAAGYSTYTLLRPCPTVGTDAQPWDILTTIDMGNIFQYPAPAGLGHLYYDFINLCITVWVCVPPSR